MYLKMYVSGLLVTAVPIRYDGLTTAQERAGYLQTTMQVLCAEHESILQRPGARAHFLVDRADEATA